MDPYSCGFFILSAHCMFVKLYYSSGLTGKTSTHYNIDIILLQISFYTFIVEAVMAVQTSLREDIVKLLVYSVNTPAPNIATCC